MCSPMCEGMPATMFVCMCLREPTLPSRSRGWLWGRDLLWPPVAARRQMTGCSPSPRSSERKMGREQLGRGQDGAIHLGCNYAQSHRRVSSSYFPLWWDQDHSETGGVMVAAQYELIVSVSVKWQRLGKWTRRMDLSSNDLHSCIKGWSSCLMQDWNSPPFSSAVIDEQMKWELLYLLYNRLKP